MEKKSAYTIITYFTDGKQLLICCTKLQIHKLSTQEENEKVLKQLLKDPMMASMNQGTCQRRHFLKSYLNWESKMCQPQRNIRPASEPVLHHSKQSSSIDQETWIDRFKKLENALQLCQIENSGNVFE
ncbi:uncharacterized protein C1orf87-like [Xenopus laevis]|uniref:Uncharacterized protein C1orf87-like n=1 Tax=Xenopus laevis TaxID=8355 RepID=A0A8J1MWU9_XENLA|nr:uncharacterized protein C1orf87-like [Xenopus laevis]